MRLRVPALVDPPRPTLAAAVAVTLTPPSEVEIGAVDMPPRVRCLRVYIDDDLKEVVFPGEARKWKAALDEIECVLRRTFI